MVPGCRTRLGGDVQRAGRSGRLGRLPVRPARVKAASKSRPALQESHS